MNEITKHINDTNASYRTLGAGDAKNTDLFLDNEHYFLFEGEGEQITVRFNKENLTKAILFIASILPRKYDNSSVHKTIPFSYTFVYEQLAFLDAFFTIDGVVVDNRTQIWNARKDVPKKNGEIDNRFYFNGLLEDIQYTNHKGERTSAKFTIRNYLAGGYSDIHIKKSEDGIFDVWVTNALKPYDYEKKDDFLTQHKSYSTSAYALDQLLQESPYRPYFTAIKSKPFLLLAGISGTGKSRIVRELARACWDEGSEEYKAQKPENFEMIQVKPNWHDSTELIGYVSRVSGEAVYVIGDFLRFVTKAWENLDVPYFLCLDEMNLAPVEQYFAEFLSVIESRKSDGEGHVTTDPILKKSTEDWYRVLTAELTGDNEALRTQFLEEGIALPQNLIVVGTVNMDETTFSFSRKVLDRAMTIEMNEVDLWGGLDYKYERIGKLSGDMLIGKAVEGVDVYADNKEVCDIALEYLKSVNEILDKTPFKVAYRTRNEFLLYVVNNLPYTIGEDGTEYSRENVIATALDEITSMKVLARIEGDDTKVPNSLLAELKRVIREQLLKITGEDDQIESVSLTKLDEMQERLKSGYTSFWS